MRVGAPGRIDLVVADIDGCIVATGHAAFRLDEVAQLRALQRASREDPDVPPLTLLSGRPQPYVDAVMQLLDVDLPAIFENGAGLAHRRPYRAELDGTARAHRARLEALRDALEPRDDVVLQAGKMASLSVFPVDDTTTGEREAVEAVEALVRAEVERLGLDLAIDPSRDCVNVLVPGVDKRTGLAWLERVTGVGADRVAGIGDSAGDRCWLAACALACAPDPADPDLRAEVGFAPPLPDIDAVLALYRRAIARNRGAPPDSPLRQEIP